MNIILNESERKPLATLLGEYKNTTALAESSFLRLSDWRSSLDTRRKHRRSGHYEPS